MNENPIVVRSTKRNSNKEIYKYYAGFSEEFVEDILKHLLVKSDDKILDPWNGSGTTTHIASILGIESVGIDINPIMYIISQSKLINVADSLHFENIIKKSRRYRSKVNENDALTKWFDINSVVLIRNLERAILNGNSLKDYYHELTEITSDSCFYLVVLINTLKKLLASFLTSNPSWIKQSPDLEKININKIEFETAIIQEFEKNQKILSKINKPCLKKPKLMVGKSEDIKYPNECFDFVISSPPYCTRIDYAIMTSVELALLNISSEDFRTLRNELIGGPVIHKIQPSVSTHWGKTCLETLEKIKNHNSYASATYYYKTYLQYFDSMYSSFKEISRVLKKEGKCVLVIQDSYYKEIFVDLKSIFIEFSENFDWDINEYYSFEVKKNISNSNTNSIYYKNKLKVSEHVIIFEKRG